jgi:hypothetical protein
MPPGMGVDCPVAIPHPDLKLLALLALVAGTNQAGMDLRRKPVNQSGIDGTYDAAFIQKPFSPIALARKVREVLGSSIQTQTASHTEIYTQPVGR